jgi:predicted alpha-1,2-mannosidase
VTDRGARARGGPRLAAWIATAAAGIVLLLPAAAAADPAAQVDPFAGTQPGANTFGGGHNFPGAAAPFGMVQFGPDTSPAERHSGGYDYRDGHIRGFSLTHLNGAGCGLYGDFPFLPTTAPINGSPAPHGASGLLPSLQPGFVHAHEHASPGYYEVRLNPSQRASINAELTATTRTGMARFSFPPSPHASVLINAGGSNRADDFSSVQIDPGANQITGAASSGYFCGQRPRYKIYFAAQFSRPFKAYGTWTQQTLQPGSTSASDDKAPSVTPSDTTQAGAYVSFDTRRAKQVEVRVGVSFVGVDGAIANLQAENPSRSFAATAGAAHGQWDRTLSTIGVSGGPALNIRTFYTALYHAFLAPRTFSDVDGRYIGMDGQIHTASGYTQYADFSGWDIYRSQIQLLAMLMPQRASDIVSSLLVDAGQSGCLGRWPYANGQSMTMVGDPADPIIASAAAFGATGFDTQAALGALVKGATQVCQSGNGSYVERQGLAAYQSLGYLPYDIDVNQRNANALGGDPNAVWGSAATTLEYATADSAIAQYAARIEHDPGAYSTFIARGGNWRNLFNPASGYIEPRYASGAFLTGYNTLAGAGFVEGNSAQYTWMVPQDPAGLADAMGGSTQASIRLTRFLSVLNSGTGGTNSPHALLGNEPTLNTPWLFDWLGRPFKTQDAVRRAILSLYSPSPAGYPGNDDLGELSSWYVFGALGMYPEVPGVGMLALGSPLFPHAIVKLPGGPLRIDGKGAGPGAPYVTSLRLNGHPYRRPWAMFCQLGGGAHLAYGLSSRARRAWGSSTSALPPSFGAGSPMPKDSCSA